jgi:hypothetical protein
MDYIGCSQGQLTVGGAGLEDGISNKERCRRVLVGRATPTRALRRRPRRWTSRALKTDKGII